jgi:hypothetical protein
MNKINITVRVNLIYLKLIFLKNKFKNIIHIHVNSVSEIT